MRKQKAENKAHATAWLKQKAPFCDHVLIQTETRIMDGVEVPVWQCTKCPTGGWTTQCSLRPT